MTLLSEIGPDGCKAAFRAWRAGSGPFLPYVRSTPFVSLARYPGDLTLPNPADLELSFPPVPTAGPGELIILDLPGTLSLQTGVTLWEQQRLWPVLTLSHWYHPCGLVGDAAQAAVLLLHAPKLAETVPSGFSLVLDYNRYSDAPLTPDVFNNQYELTEDDLPTASELRQHGIQAACLVTDSKPKDDLRRYAAYLTASGLTVRWHP